MKIIAISQRVQKIEKYNEFRDQIDNRLIIFLVKAGFIPVPIPNFKKSNKSDQLSLINWLKKINPSGIILSGGDDIGVYKFRDSNEMRIIKWSLSKKITVLGICRGMQVINKYFGGTKVKVKNHAGTRHKIKMHKSNVTRIVNSYHNWGFYSKNIAKKLEVKALASDLTVEYFKSKTSNIYGIMWHPEREKNFNQEDLFLVRQIFQK